IAPVYASETVPTTLAARRTELRGWAVAVVDAQAFLQSVVARTPGFERVDLYDGATAKAAKAMAHVPTTSATSARPAATHTMHLTTADSHTLTVRYRAFFDAEDPQVGSTRRLLLYAGLALSFLVFAIAQVVRRSETRAQRMVNEATESLRESEEWFQAIVQSSNDIFFVVDEVGVVRYASPAFEWMLGYPRDTAVGWQITGLVHPDDRDRVTETFVRFSEGRTSEPCRCRARHADGRWIDVEAVASYLLDNPVIGGHVISVRDVTERREAATALAEAQEMFRTAFEEAPIGMCITDVDGVVMRANPSLGRILGYTPEGLVGVRMADLTHADDVSMSQAELARLKETGGDGYRIEKRYVHRDGRTVWTSLSVSLVRDGEGRPLYTIGQTEDITERKAIADRLAHAAIHDPLTGLPNRVLFMDRLQHALTRSERKGSRVGVVFLDLDRFKLVNDSLGHTAGDRLLVAIADRLRSALRPSDTVARFGGDEFVVLCDDVLDEAATVDIASRMAAAVARPVLLPEGEVFVTASIGVALSGRPGDSADNLLRDADTAMYRAKDQGRARTEVFDERTHDRVVHHLRTGNDLHRALQRREFEVHYQPVVDLETGLVSGFEALVRWRHPTRGLVHPSDFISLAEETGLIVPLGAWVLEESCRQVVEWQAHRPEGARPLTISVNLSPRQLTEPTLLDEVTRVLDETGIDPDCVWLEITESTLMHDAESAVSTLRALRLLGVHLSVDDFGTGYSSLSYLKRFPVEALKVDRSFVDGLGNEPGDSAIVTAVVTMAHALGLRAIAEGLETPIQLRELRTLGCDMAQGFMFGVPRSATELGAHPADDLSTWEQVEVEDALGGERRAG
ncbi:MAG TPA: EAL domain-containing protein, partial [Acidimicrobiia bacterium]|nr:EAL domain-containing protein [Acidimicrobiia bacterium]